MDHYKTLGVERNASPEEIKKAYRKLAGQHHPDKGGDTKKFQQIEEAYRTLSDPQQKGAYDNPNQGNPFNMNFGGGFGPGFPGGFQFHTQGFNTDDLFAQMFGGQRGGKPPPPTYRTAIWVSLEQVYTGADQTLQLQTPNGIQVAKIQTPKGVENGAVMRFDNIIPNAVLIVEFRIHDHPKYKREGFNLISEYLINVFDLVVGTKFKFDTLGGKSIDVIVNDKTQPNSKIKLPGHGLPVNNQFGDQYILLKPFIPDTIDQRITDSILLNRPK